MHRYLLVAALLSLTACKKENPAYCDQSPTPSDCPAPDSAPGCTTDEQCPGQVCDVPSGTCVQCTASNATACTDAAPVCDADDHTCRACTAHSECASNACLPDGTCAAEDQVAYVTTNGASTDCTHAAPCAELSTALATDRPIIKIQSDPAKATAPIIIDARTLTIVAEPGAALDRDGDGPILELHNAANVHIADLRVTGASGQVTDPAIRLQDGSPQLALTRVKIDTNVGPGISSSGGSLTVTQSTLSGNQGGGISVTASGATTFHITNNFIVRNGGSSSAIGGLYLGSGTGSGSEFAFNTIVDNEVTTGAANSGGVVCLNVGFAGANNLIARNFINNNATASNSNSFGDCTYDIAATSTVEALKFVEPDMTPYDYHLGSGSTAIDHATTPSTVDVDLDGDARPQGAQKDQGADEYTP